MWVEQSETKCKTQAQMNMRQAQECKNCIICWTGLRKCWLLTVCMVRMWMTECPFHNFSAFENSWPHECFRFYSMLFPFIFNLFIITPLYMCLHSLLILPQPSASSDFYLFFSHLCFLHCIYASLINTHYVCFPILIYIHTNTFPFYFIPFPLVSSLIFLYFSPLMRTFILSCRRISPIAFTDFHFGYSSLRWVCFSLQGAEHSHPGISLLVTTTTSWAKLFIATDHH